MDRFYVGTGPGEADGRAGASLAFCPDFAPMSLDELFGNVKSQAGARYIPVGGVVGTPELGEKVGQVFW